MSKLVRHGEHSVNLPKNPVCLKYDLFLYLLFSSCISTGERPMLPTQQPRR
jgi:hypothetical protein